MIKINKDLFDIISLLIIMGLVFIFPYSYSVLALGIACCVLDLIFAGKIKYNDNSHLKLLYEKQKTKIIDWSQKHPILNMIYIFLVGCLTLNGISLLADHLSMDGWSISGFLFISLFVINCVFIPKIMTWLKNNNKSKSVIHTVLSLIIIFDFVSVYLMSLTRLHGDINIIELHILPLWWFIQMWFKWASLMIRGFDFIFMYLLPILYLFIFVYGIVKKVPGLNIFLTKLALILFILSICFANFLDIPGVILLTMSFILGISIYIIIKKGRKK